MLDIGQVTENLTRIKNETFAISDQHSHLKTLILVKVPFLEEVGLSYFICEFLLTKPFPSCHYFVTSRPRT